jgi:signal transduction histidine kinase
MRILLCFIYCLVTTGASSQVPDSSIIQLSAIHNFMPVEKNTFFLSTEKDSVADSNIPSLHFTSVIRGKKTVPDKIMEKDCFVKFVMHNGDDTARTIYFTPGYYLKAFRLYHADPGNETATFRPVPKDTQKIKPFAGCQLITLGAHKTEVYYARYNYLRIQTNAYAPRIINNDFLWTWVMMKKVDDVNLNVITYVATGILLLMIFYSLAVFAQNRQKEFIYYAGYVFFTGIMVFLKSFLNFKPTPFNLFFEEYLDLIIICIGIFFYLAFIRKFLNTGVREPFLEKLLLYAGISLFAMLVAYSVIYFFTDKYIILNTLENYVIKVQIFITGVIVVIYSFKKKDPLLNYLAAGNIALIFFSIISLGMLMFRWTFVPNNPTSVFNRSLFYYEIGLICELALFLFGLAYKNKKDIIAQVKERESYKLEAERKEFEKQMAIMAVRQEERDRISADMHDDLGSGVTAIRLMSEIVKSKMNTEQYPEIDKISNSANELLGKMNSIIWTMKSSNDTLESLVAYLRSYATEYFDGTAVDCIMEVQNIIEREVTGEKRRNIFLSFKETLNNILKHAKATAVKIRIHADEKQLSIVIHDNGVGIDLKNVRRFGNGLNNIKKRMQSINGEFIIGQDNGTMVCFEINLETI